MTRLWRMTLVAAAVLTLAGCGGRNDATPGDAATERTPTPTATATATATTTSTGDAAPERVPRRGKCDEVKYEATDTSGTVHPRSNFFEPDDTDLPTEGDLGHLLLRDNAVVIVYAANTPR